MGKWLEGYPIGTKMTATDFVMLILVIPYNVLTARMLRHRTIIEFKESATLKHVLFSLAGY